MTWISTNTGSAVFADNNRRHRLASISLKFPVGILITSFDALYQMADDTVTFWGDPFRLHWIPIDGAKLNVFLYAWPQGASGECVIDIIGKRRKSSTRKAAYIFSHNILPQGVKRITNCHKAPPGSSITAAHLNIVNEHVY